MKISKPLLVCLGAALVLSPALAQTQTKTNCTPNKAQLILRQKMADLDAASALPSKDQLLADVDRLHREGKISDQQFDAFKKNVNQQYEDPGGPSTSEAQARAQKALEQKIAELNAGQPAVTPQANPEIQARAQEALHPVQKVEAPRAAAAPHPETAPVAQEVLHQRIAELQTQQKSNVVPEHVATTLTPELEARARELLRLKIAEAHKGEPTPSVASTPAQATALTVLHQQEAELKAGITPDTPKQTRILRAKIAESRGTLTHDEAARVAAGPAPTAVAASQPGGTAPSFQGYTPAPALGASPVVFQTSNKTGLARLNELTALYKADRITPFEYHHERAKIVSTL